MTGPIITGPDVKITYDQRRTQALRAAVDLIGADARPAALVELAEWIVSGPAIVQTSGLITQEQADQMVADLRHAGL